MKNTAKQLKYPTTRIIRDLGIISCILFTTTKRYQRDKQSSYGKFTYRFNVRWWLTRFVVFFRDFYTITKSFNDRKTVHGHFVNRKRNGRRDVCQTIVIFYQKDDSTFPSTLIYDISPSFLLFPPRIDCELEKEGAIENEIIELRFITFKWRYWTTSWLNINHNY